MSDKSQNLGGSAKEVIMSLERLIHCGRDAEIKEASIAFFQTHMNAESTEVKIRVRF